jgi:hypothetical protein
MFGITIILLALSLATTVIGALLIEKSTEAEHRSIPLALVGCAMLSAGLYASIYYAIGLTQ